MKIKLIAFAVFLQIALLSFSQTIQVAGSDTTCKVPINLIRAANVLFVEKDSLEFELNHLQEFSEKKDSLIYLFKEVYKKDSTTIKILNTRIKVLKSAIEHKDKEISRVKKRSLITNIATGAGALVLIVLAFL